MATITYLYNVGQTVWHVSLNDGVREGVIKMLEIKQVFPAIAPTISYTAQFVNAANGSVVDVEATFYDNVDDALAAYRVLLTT